MGDSQVELLQEEVKAFLDKPYESLLANAQIIDMFAKVFGHPLCRHCECDRIFAHTKLNRFLKDGNTQLNYG